MGRYNSLLMTISEFNHMLTTHTRSLKNFAFQFTRNIDDADDLYQDTVLKAINYFEKFSEGTNLKAWLFTIMRNTFINDYRKEMRSNLIIHKCEDFSSVNLLKSSSKNQAEGKFVIRDVEKILSLLPKDYSVPFVKYFEGYKYHEIADQLEIPLGTVKTRIHMAREILKKQLKMYSKTREAV
jgi:RNA polymerase sigma factor (sigma-70 family)